MSDHKKLNLEEARKQNKLAKFAKEHPAKGHKPTFDRLLAAMVKKPPSKAKT